MRRTSTSCRAVSRPSTPFASRTIASSVRSNSSFWRISSRRIVPLYEAAPPFLCDPHPQLSRNLSEHILLVTCQGLDILPQGRLHVLEVWKTECLVNPSNLAHRVSFQVLEAD